MSNRRTFLETVIGADVPLAVRDYGGEGPDLVLLHGAGRTLLDWSLLVEALPGFRIVAMDLRCHGFSGDGPWSWRAVLEDLQLVIDRLGLHRPAVIGHSLGGIVAGLWATGHADCPAAVNLDGFWSGAPELYYGMEPDVVRQRLAEMQALSGQQDPAPLSEDHLDSVIAAQRAAAEASGLDPAMAERALRRSLQVSDGLLRPRPGPDVAHDLLAAVEATDLMSIWSATQCPLLLVSCNRVEQPGGELPEWVLDMLVAYRAGLARVLADMEAREALITVEVFDGDHGLVWNQPWAVADLVTAFLDTHLDQREALARREGLLQ